MKRFVRKPTVVPNWVRFNSLEQGKRGPRIEAAEKVPAWNMGKHSLKGDAETIFKAAEAFHAGLKPGVHVIFPGMGMRPFFEAVRGLNELNRRIPRKHLHYFVMPDPVWFESFEGYDFIDPPPFRERIGEMAGSGNPKEFLVVDYQHRRNTFNAIEQELKRVNPKSKVTFLNQYDNVIGDGVYSAEGYPHPTEKTLAGHLRQEPREAHRGAYLLFQRELQAWLERKRLELARKRN